MKAIMLAAGTGTRLSGGDDAHPPKVLLEFGGRSLLQRHLDALKALQIESLTLVVGYRAGDISRALDALGGGGFVRTVENKDFRRGSLVSLWTAREALTGGGPVLFMDADVLYPPALLERLVAAREENCFLYDRHFEPGEEPVKLCLEDGRPVELSKKIEGTYDDMGEWVGFLKLSGSYAAKLAELLDEFMDQGRLDEPMEEAVRALLQSSPPDAFSVVDVSELPWIEIDMPEDVARARDVVLPAFEKAKGAQTR